LAYARSIRRFMRELSRLDETERAEAFEDRQGEIQEMASRLKKVSRSNWKRASSFGFSILGAFWSVKTGNPIGALLSGSGAIAGRQFSSEVEAGAYTYIFRAASRRFM